MYKALFGAYYDLSYVTDVHHFSKFMLKNTIRIFHSRDLQSTLDTHGLPIHMMNLFESIGGVNENKVKMIVKTKLYRLVKYLGNNISRILTGTILSIFI